MREAWEFLDRLTAGLSEPWASVARWALLALTVIAALAVLTLPILQLAKMLRSKPSEGDQRSENEPPTADESGPNHQPLLQGQVDQLRLFLIARARQGVVVTYQAAAGSIGMQPGAQFFPLLHQIAVYESAGGRPILTAIVHGGTPPGGGFWQHIGFASSQQPGAVERWQQEKRAVFDYWARH